MSFLKYVKNRTSVIIVNVIKVLLCYTVLAFPLVCNIDFIVIKLTGIFCARSTTFPSLYQVSAPYILL